MIGLAAAAQRPRPSPARGSLDVTRLRRVLKARQLVGVRGAGPAFDGLYYVKSVTHKIKRGEYKQDFTLTPQRFGLHSANGADHERRQFETRIAIRPRYYGKYRGSVIDNIDPLQIGRIMAGGAGCARPELPSSWAMPCVPAAGSASRLLHVPPIGSQVWVEFEQGDPDYPIWTGGFWGLVAEVPVFATAPPPIPPGQNIVLQTTGQNMLLVSDAPPTPATGGIILKSTSGAMIVVNDIGNLHQQRPGGAITLVGPAVDVNLGGLTVI